MSNGHVDEGEFKVSIAALSRQIEDVAAVGRETLTEARRTNGRVSSLEVANALLEARLNTIESRAEPITRRDLWVAVIAVTTVFGAAKWLPALLHLGSQAP